MYVITVFHTDMKYRAQNNDQFQYTYNYEKNTNLLYISNGEVNDNILRDQPTSNTYFRALKYLYSSLGASTCLLTV